MLLHVLQVSLIGHYVGRISRYVVIDLYSVPVFKMLIVGCNGNAEKCMTRCNDNLGM